MVPVTVTTFGPFRTMIESISTSATDRNLAISAPVTSAQAGYARG